MYYIPSEECFHHETQQWVHKTESWGCQLPLYRTHASQLSGKEGSYSGGWEDLSWFSRGNGAVFPMFWTKSIKKLYQPNLGRTANGPDSSGMKAKVTPSGKEPWLSEVLAEGKGNRKWVVDGGSFIYSYDYMVNYRNKDCNSLIISYLFWCKKCLFFPCPILLSHDMC